MLINTIIKRKTTTFTSNSLMNTLKWDICLSLQTFNYLHDLIYILYFLQYYIDFYQSYQTFQVQVPK